MTSTDPVTRHQSNAIIVEQNQPIPASDEAIFVTIDEGQTEILVHLNEGNYEDLGDVLEIAQSPALFGRAVRKGYPMRVKVSVNDQGLIECYAWDGENPDRKMMDMEVIRPSILSRKQVQAERALNATWKRIG